MEKFCVFCGENPEEKNMEHVIPKWLIELTGDVNRKIRVDFDFGDIDHINMREYSFNAFKFPACKECNTKFSKLEGITKPIIIKMINRKDLNESEVSTLLDWIDKIRIGLWLAYLYLNKNYCSIDPNYHISFRVGASDRMIAIYFSKEKINRINFMGVNIPIFQYTPCCFTLVINEIYLFNLSTNYLISRRIGFPFPESSFLLDGDKEGKNLIELRPGLGRVLRPLIKRPLIKPCTELYQPIFHSFNNGVSPKEFYDNDYIRNKCIDWDKGIGKIFIQEDNKLLQYPSDATSRWQTISYFSRNYLDKNIGIQTLEFQNYLMNLGPSLEKLSKEKRKQVKHDFNFAKNFNKIAIERWRKQS